VKLGFCLFRYFPYGGLQRDFLKVAMECRRRGHRILAYVMDWQGEVPEGLELEVVCARGITNAARCRDFAAQVARKLGKEDFACVTGFNKMPGLDVYFAADPCFAARLHEDKPFLCRFSRSNRIYRELERSVFSPQANVRILMLTRLEQERYVKYYRTPAERFTLLPPGISRDRIISAGASERGLRMRQEFGIGADEKLVLMVGSGFRTKGLDRSLRALASLPEKVRSQVRLVVIGAGDTRPFLKLAERLGVGDRVRLLGPRDDVPDFLLAADMLLHPSYTEAAGMVLLEAMAAGLPVLATDICGYAFHIQQASAGLLIPSPFRQERMNQLFAHMLFSDQLSQWRRNGLDYVARNDISSLPERAADVIEEVARRRGHL
jgi:UDP-glucose:(heptosyl)LPS alpha-1,3-glucosyltransferase